MAKIRIKALPFDDSLGMIRYEKTTEKTQGKRISRDISPCALLQEAIRFYNFGFQPRSGGLGPTGFQFKKDEKEWQPLNVTVMNKAIFDLCLAFRDALLDMGEELTKKVILEVHLKSGIEKKYPLYFSSNRGLLAAHLMIADNFRVEVKNRKKPWIARDFERLTEALSSLQGLVDKTNLEQLITKQFEKYLIKGAKVDEFFFKPYWGGTWLIRPQMSFWYPERPFYPYYNREVGSTEKLHLGVVSNAFMPEEIIRSGLNKDLPQTARDFLAKFQKGVEAVERILPTLDEKKLPPTQWRRRARAHREVDYRPMSERTAIWREWRKNLYELAHLFGYALEARHFPHGVETRPAVMVGLPCALALIGVLQTYLADLMAKALMVALQLAINEIYNWVDGYLAVALWEALSGEDAEGFLTRGCLAYLEGQGAAGRASGGKLVGRLQNWRVLPYETDFWGLKEPVNGAALAILTMLSKEPLVKEGKQKPHHFFAVKSVSKDILFSDYKTYLPRYPVLKKNLGIKHAPFTEHDWLHGARFVAQAHLFVAHQILERAGSILWRKWEKKNKYKTPHYDKEEFKKRRWDNFRVGAGSYWWAGQKPPHLTHREGVNFDINFGPDLVPWPNAIGFRNEYKKCKGITKRIKDIENIAKIHKVKMYYIHTPLAVCYKISDLNQAKKGTSQQLVYRQLIHDAIQEKFKIVKQYALQTIAGKDSDSEKENEDYQKVESSFIGTPHFMSPEEATRAGITDKYQTELPDWQRSHAAHLALMLSVPRSIVFASPIIHLRSMRAIRAAFRGRHSFALASELVAHIYFDFKPHDHHHHWHINYHHENALDKFKKYFPLWIEIGIDFKPFLNYLHEYPLPEKRSYFFKDVIEEYEKVYELCDYYEVEKNKYDKEEVISKEKENEFICNILNYFEPYGDLIYPTILLKHVNNIEKTDILGKVYKDTQAVNKKILNILIEEKCITKEVYKAYLEDEEVLDEVPTIEEFQLSPPAVKGSGME